MDRDAAAQLPGVIGRFVVIGAGAVGGVVGAHLALAGREVLLVARGVHAVAIREQGLRLETPARTTTVAIAVAEDITTLAWRADDIVLLAVKSQDAAAALRQLAAVAPDVAVVCLTNGIEVERIAARWFPDVYAVCVRLPATFATPGTVQAWSAPLAGTLDLGRYPRRVDERGRALATIFSKAGLDSIARADVMRWKRGKLLSNLGNAAEALCGPSARKGATAVAARAEGIACLEAAGLDWIDDTDEPRKVASVPIAGATRAGGSTWQSLARGKPVECEYLNGEITLLGRLHGVATPVNAALLRLVTRAAASRATPGAMTEIELDVHCGARVTPTYQ